MAIDSRNKRASCLAVDGGVWEVFPNADGDLANQPDREQISWVYAAVLAAITYVTNLLDINTNLHNYLKTVVFTSSPTGDLPTLTVRELAALTHTEGTARFKALIHSAGSTN